MKIKTVVDFAKEYIEKNIISGNFKPGQKLKEDEIINKLKISKPPVREAFKILESEGLLNRIPRRGVYITELNQKDIWEIYTLKMAIYGLCSRLVTEKIKDNEIKKLEKIVNDMKNCIQQNPPNIIKYQNLNTSFHLTIINIINHGRIKKIFLNLNNQIHRYSNMTLANNTHLNNSYEYHLKILNAIKQKDKELAEKLTYKHIEEGLEVLLNLIEK